MYYTTTLVLFVLCAIIHMIVGHGRLIDPASRNAMFRYGFENPPNYNDNELNCGGFGHQFSKDIDGKCGVCGDPFAQAQLHVFGGRYANNIIAKTYRKGQEITVKVELTSNHKGYFVFKIGDIGTPPITQEKLLYTLKLQATGGTRYYLPTNSNGIFTVQLKLPESLVCRQCVLQWTYTAGNNNYGTREGPQETFVNCADVRIVDGNGGLPAPPPNPPLLPESKPVQSQTRVEIPAPVRSGAGCRATGAFASILSMNAWCQDNCPQNCPATHCICD